MGFSKWECIMGGLAFIAFFGFVAFGAGDSNQLRQKEETSRIISCNKLKEIAIVAKAPEPTCAK